MTMTYRGKNAAVSFTCVDQSTLFSGIVILVSRTVVQEHNEAEIAAKKELYRRFIYRERDLGKCRVIDNEKFG